MCSFLPLRKNSLGVTTLAFAINEYEYDEVYEFYEMFIVSLHKDI